MRWFYTILLYLATPFIMLRLLWRSRSLPGYRQRWGERFARYQFKPISASIWLHAVSVGEFIAALPMIKALLAEHPGLVLVVTTTTPTGSEQVIKHFADQVVHVYTPYDLPTIIKRFLRHMNPQAAIIMETELWPNVLYALRQAGIPTLLANARLSARSARGYQRISGLTQQMLSCFSRVAAQSASDGERFVKLGLPAERLVNTGNIKFDLLLPDDLVSAGETFRQSLGARTVWVVASTHQGEEELLIEVYQQLKVHQPDLLMVLVPRHPDRFDKVYSLCCSKVTKVVRRSLKVAVSDDTDILLGDTMGEMKLFFAAADFAFIAGSLVPIGGHNMIEAAILAVPVWTGHYLQNFLAIRDMLCAEDALCIVESPDQLVESMLVLLKDREKAREMGLRGQAVIMRNQGALAKHLALINQLIKDIPYENDHSAKKILDL